MQNEMVSRKKVFGRSVIIRKRKIQHVYGFENQRCFYKASFRKFSLYVEKGSPERSVGFGKITDK